MLCDVNLWDNLINQPILRYYNSDGELVRELKNSKWKLVGESRQKLGSIPIKSGIVSWKDLTVNFKSALNSGKVKVFKFLSFL